MDHILTVRQMAAELLELVQNLQSELRRHQESIVSFGYALGPICERTKSPSSFSQIDISELIDSYAHFNIDHGENAKHVHRYPGVIAIRDDELYQHLIGHVEHINELKRCLQGFLAENGKPTHVMSESGISLYVKNDLLYKALPMVNHLMLTRHIDCDMEYRSSVSFSWNIDFVHRPLPELDVLFTSLKNKISEPPLGLSHNLWAKEVEFLIRNLENYLNSGTTLKIIDPKPIEPVVFFGGSKSRTKAKLPILVKANADFYCRKPLNEPPVHPMILKNGRSVEYRKLSEHFNFYACL